MTDPVFGFSIPTTCPDVPSEVLIPRNTWQDKEAYDRQAADLAARFKKNFQQFTLPSDEVRNAGPRSILLRSDVDDCRRPSDFKTAPTFLALRRMPSP